MAVNASRAAGMRKGVAEGIARVVVVIGVDGEGWRDSCSDARVTFKGNFQKLA